MPIIYPFHSLNKLKNIDVNTLTPIEAMTVLFELQKEAESI